MLCSVVREEGWYGQSKYKTSNIKFFYDVSVSAFLDSSFSVFNGLDHF